MSPTSRFGLRLSLLGSAAFLAVLSVAEANAQTAPGQTAPSQTAPGHTAPSQAATSGNAVTRTTGGPLKAIPAAPTATASGDRSRVQALAAGEGETVSVYGQGSTRQLTSVSARTIQQAAPGTSPLKVLSQLPGVDFQSADPFGAYEWSARVYVRGFAQSQLGFTLDDIPLGDQAFNNYNGLSITRAIISDNVARANVSQGAGSVSIASTSNLGGALQFYSADPADTYGGAIDQSFGSNDTYRTFVRLESGVLNASGTKFTVSYAHTDLDKWKGQGYNESDQVNGKLVQPVGGSSSLKLFFDWSAIKQFDYQDESLNYLQTLGGRVDNTYPDYAAAYKAAEGIYSHNETLTNDPEDVSYYAGTGTRQDFLSGLTFDSLLTDRLNWKSTVYGHGDSGYSTWTTPYTPSPNGAPLSIRTMQPAITRYGLLSALSWDIGRHTVESGIWYEYDQFTEARYFSEAPLLGQGTLGDPNDHTPDNPFAVPWAEVWNTNTFQYHLQDTWRVLPTVTLNAGFRSLVIHTGNEATAQDPAYNGGSEVGTGALTAANGFLPQFSGNWRFARHQELFADISHNMRGYPEDGYSTNSSNTPWSANETAFKQIQNTLKPETDWVYEGGYRLTTKPFVGLLSLYHVDFSNRLQTISFGPVINPTTAVQNVGGVTTNGVELSGTFFPLRHLSFYNSISYNRSTFDDDLTTSAGVYDLRGKSIPNYPTLMYKGSIAYQIGRVSAHIDGDYYSHRYLSYLNDASVPGYFITSLGVRAVLGERGPLSRVTLQLNAYNLFNTRYVATTGENGNPLSGDYQSFLMGAPRQFFGSVAVTF